MDYSRVGEILWYAEVSVELKDKADRRIHRRIQGTLCLLHDKDGKSTEKDAITDCDACKLLQIIYTILKNGMVYDSKKMLMYIRRPEKKKAIAI